MGSTPSSHNSVAALTVRVTLPEAVAVGATAAVAGAALTTAPNLVTLPGTEEAAAGERPVYKKAWFWGVMAVVASGMGLLFVGSEHPYATAPDPVHGNILATLSGLCWALTLMGLRWMGRSQHAAPGSAVPAVVMGNLIAFFLGLFFALPVQAARPLDWAIVTGLGTIQIGVAYVVLGGAVAADDLRAWVRARLADYKVPDRVIAVEQMPVTSVGKIAKRALLDSGNSRNAEG